MPTASCRSTTGCVRHVATCNHQTSLEEGVRMAFRLAVCLCVLVLGTILARPATGDDRLKQEPKYDTTTVIDFGAVVVEVQEVQKDNPLRGVNLVVRSDSDATFNIYVAPAEYVKSFEITFRKGDNVHIIGSKI